MPDELIPEIRWLVLISVIVPFYNEANTLKVLIDRIITLSLPRRWRLEIILVNDGSIDSSLEIAQSIKASCPDIVRLLSSDTNRGKGHAVRAGIGAAKGDVCLIQDADLEYDPRDYEKIIRHFEDPETDVVYGSRIMSNSEASYFRYYWGGRFLTLVTNLLFGSHITDEPTGYKAFRREIVEGLNLTSDGFELCPELTAKLILRGHRIVEVPIHYTPRSFGDGKKICARDGWIAIWTLLKLRFSFREAPSVGIPALAEL